MGFVETNSNVLADVYTVQEVAAMLKLKIRNAYDFCNNTTCFKVFRVGRSIRIDKASYDMWRKTVAENT